MRKATVVLWTSLLAHAAGAQFLQQGSKLVGTGALGPGDQGGSVAISADGTTAIAGAYYDNSNVGAAWIFIRSAGMWSQQGSKLVGNDAVVPSTTGVSVAISADGSTAIVGGPYDDGNVGAAWVFTRNGGVWSQQGSKLVGAGAVGAAWQGESVAISADGNTAIVGGPYDDGNVGAAWVFTRNGGVWSQQGSKLVGAGAVGVAYQGGAVAISADGGTLVLGGSWDDPVYPSYPSANGAVWIFTLSGGVWSQQGSKLVGTGAIAGALQGGSVAISADGNTIVEGGSYDVGGVGASWVFTRSGGVWSQQGDKLVGAGAVGRSYQGESVAISADGNTALASGPYDNSDAGAVWVFARSGGLWLQQGSKLVGADVAVPAWLGWRAAISADGTTAVIGGPGDNSGVGAAWVFVSSATRLAFAQQPTTTAAGQPISPAVTVQLQDGSGAPVAQAGVTMTASMSSGAGTLGGTLSRVTDTSGLATFDDLSIDLIGSKQLTASNPGRTSAVSSLFTITAGAAATIVATGGTPQSAQVWRLFGQPLQVMVTDSFGNAVAGALVTYGVPASGPSATLSGGGAATTDSGGNASVTAAANGIMGGPYTVTAAIGRVPPAPFALTNLPATPVPTLGGMGLLGLALLVLALGAFALQEH